MAIRTRTEAEREIIKALQDGKLTPEEAHGALMSLNRNKPVPSYTNPIDNSFTLEGMIAMRLRIQQGSRIPFDHLNCAYVTPEKVAVFVVQNGQHMVLEDDANLFPSDTLITQLRLIMPEVKQAPSLEVGGGTAPTTTRLPPKPVNSALWTGSKA